MNCGLKIVLTLALMVLTVISCDREGRVIPVRKMEKIYREMLLADQWLAENPGKKDMADTTWFYEPIFKKYGFSLKDYQKSVGHYLNDPKRYAEMMDRVQKGLTSEMAAVNARIAAADKLQHEADSISRALKAVKGKPFSSFLDVFDQDAMTDRVEIERDSLGVYRPVPVVEDTVFHGPRLVVRDTSDVAAKDSLLAVMHEQKTVSPMALPREDDGPKVFVSKKLIPKEKILSKELIVTE